MSLKQSSGGLCRTAKKASAISRFKFEDDALKQLITVSNSDARTALNALELAAMTTLPDAEGLRHVTLPVIEDALQHRALMYNRRSGSAGDFVGIVGLPDLILSRQSRDDRPLKKVVHAFTPCDRLKWR